MYEKNPSSLHFVGYVDRAIMSMGSVLIPLVRVDQWFLCSRTIHARSRRRTAEIPQPAGAPQAYLDPDWVVQQLVFVEISE